jgi:hypothetical protein
LCRQTNLALLDVVEVREVVVSCRCKGAIVMTILRHLVNLYLVPLMHPPAIIRSHIVAVVVLCVCVCVCVFCVGEGRRGGVAGE